jgi:hypothetical protein
MENKKKNIARNDRNRPITKHVRGFQHILYKNRWYFEDPQVSDAGEKPQVHAVTLYCPAWGGDGRGGTERHGVYLGIGDPMADHPSYQGKAGYCPRCNHNPKEEAAAIREIADLYTKGGRDIPEDTAKKLSASLLTGGQA